MSHGMCFWPESDRQLFECFEDTFACSIERVTILRTCMVWNSVHFRYCEMPLISARRWALLQEPGRSLCK
jgi:hypothetical protein